MYCFDRTRSSPASCKMAAAPAEGRARSRARRPRERGWQERGVRPSLQLGKLGRDEGREEREKKTSIAVEWFAFFLATGMKAVKNILTVKVK